jgi:hypothetical protein
LYRIRVRVMVFNTTFNNILVISWRSVLLVEETGLTLRKPPTFGKLLRKYNKIYHNYSISNLIFDKTRVVNPLGYQKYFLLSASGLVLVDT